MRGTHEVLPSSIDEKINGVQRRNQVEKLAFPYVFLVEYVVFVSDEVYAVRFPRVTDKPSEMFPSFSSSMILLSSRGCS